MRNQRLVLIVGAAIAALFLLGIIATGAGVYVFTQASARADRDRLREIDEEIVTTLDAQMQREREVNKAGGSYRQDAKWQELRERVERLESEGDEIRRRR